MKTTTFITNITCARCVEEVSQILENTHWIQDFTFDISHGRNYLKVTFHDAYAVQDVVHLIAQAGYVVKERRSILRFFGL